MSFQCGLCGKQTQPGEKATRIVTETRKKEYPRRPNANGYGKDDPGGVGTEIVTEVLACKSCSSVQQ